MASSFFPEKLLGSPALYSGVVILAGLSSAGWKSSSSSSSGPGSSISGSGMISDLGRVEIASWSGSSVVGDSCHDRTSIFLQGLCILLSPLSLVELLI